MKNSIYLLLPSTLLAITSATSCSKMTGLPPKKCDTSFGLSKEESDFRESDFGYTNSYKRLMEMNKYFNLRIKNDNMCGFKVEKSVSCYHFIDIDNGIGYKMCVNPRNGNLFSYEKET